MTARALLALTLRRLSVDAALDDIAAGLRRDMLTAERTVVTAAGRWDVRLAGLERSPRRGADVIACRQATAELRDAVQRYREVRDAWLDVTALQRLATDHNHNAVRACPAGPGVVAVEACAST